MPTLDGIDVENVWFQQDGATCHTSHATIDLLRETFDGRLISRNGDQLAAKKLRFDTVGQFPVRRS